MQHASQAEFTPFDAAGWRLGIVVAQFNRQITTNLLASAMARAADYKLQPHHITTVAVAGAVEIPLALQRLAVSGNYQALLAIGCVIKGDTPHFDYVCKLVSEGVLRVQLDYSMPVGFGILTCNTVAEAQARQILGGEHLDAVLQLARSLEALQ